MNQKTMISITLMAAFTIAIVTASTGIKAEAYTADLNAATSGAYNTAKNVRVATFAMETCTNQMNAGDYSHVDACASLIKTFDKYMTLAVTEGNSNIQEITGYGQQGLVGSSGLVN
jgi:hypothetical protein